MQEYVTAFTASKHLGHTNDKKIKVWIELHNVEPDAVVIDYYGNKTRLFKMETIEALAKLHEDDVSRRGARVGPAPNDFSYTELVVVPNDE